MKLKRRHKIVIILLSLFLFVTWIECEQRFVVRGRVVEANTGKPIEGASIAIHWSGTHIAAMFAPYASGTYLIEDAKSTSNKDGYFEIPKYFLKSFYMGVYKKGYVCWSSNRIFLKGGKRTKRIWFWVKPGMTIKLEPMTSEYPRFKHAGFIEVVSGNSGGLEGAGEEIDYYYDKKMGRRNEE